MPESDPNAGTGTRTRETRDDTRDAPRRRQLDDDDQIESRISDTLERIFGSRNFRGETERAISARERDNAKLRRRNNEFRDRIAELEKIGPKEGGIVLTKDEAADWKAFQELKVKPADLKTSLAELETLRGKEAERTDEEKFADAADALGFENVAALTRVLKREGLHLEFQDRRERDEESGRSIVLKVPVVRPAKDEKAQLEPLADYLERELPEFIPVFEVAPENGGADEGEETETDKATRSLRSGRSGRASTALSRKVAGSASATSTASGGITGVSMPVTRRTQPSTGASRDKKREEELVAQKRAAGGYSL